MEVILLERIGKLGQMGDVVRVKDGFARNFLLPRGKALRATAENKSRFESMKAELQARNQELKGQADAVAAKLDGKTMVAIRQASEAGQLFGSVSNPHHAVNRVGEAAAGERPQGARRPCGRGRGRPAKRPPKKRKSRPRSRRKRGARTRSRPLNRVSSAHPVWQPGWSQFSAPAPLPPTASRLEGWARAA